MLLDLLKAPGLCMVCYGNVSSMQHIYGKTLDSSFFLKLMPENQGHSGRLTVYVQAPWPKRCVHKPNLGFLGFMLLT